MILSKAQRSHFILSFIIASSFALQANALPATYHVAGSANLVENVIPAEISRQCMNKRKSGPSKKVILLTIDDGPTKRSQVMLDVLAKHKIKAIFFVNGIHNNDAPEMIKKEFDAGHAIGNHTWSHPNLKHISNEKGKEEIEKDSALIKKITGSEPKFFRPPYGEGTSFVRDLSKKENMIFMDWSLSALDWEKNAQQKEVFLSNVVKHLHPGAILLIHEHPWSAEYFDEMLTSIESQGYTFIDPKDITN